MSGFATERRPSRPTPRRPLIAGKLRPPAPPARLVARPRIDGLIAGMVEQYPLLVVVATPGAGKTTAVAESTRLLDRALAWVTASDADVAAGRLLEYVSAAISAHVPSTEGLVRSAMAAGLSHEEVGALLVEAVGDGSLLVVIDEVERVSRSPSAMGVVEALVRYLPAEMRLVLISRSELPIDVASLQLAGRAGVVDERDLALTFDEVSEALQLLGADGVDAGEALELTGGWVAGVMFEAWRATDRPPGDDGAADPMRAYLARNIVRQLPDAERELLLETSVMTSVTAERASAIGVADAEARLAGLRERHLPATWRSPPLTMRCHPRFREYLVECFGRTGGARVADAWLSLGHLAEADGYTEEAVEAFLKAGALAEAAAAAELCIVSIVERRDFEVAERWLAALDGVRDPASAAFVTAELLIAAWTDPYVHGAALGDRLLDLGRREELARSSSRVAALLAVSYVGRARHADARSVLGVAQRTPWTEAAHYLLSIQDDEPVEEEPPVPVATGGPLDAMILRSKYHRGLIARVAEEPPPVWEGAIEPWRVLAMQAMGQTARALEHYERAPDRGPMWMAGAELMIELGRAEEAGALIGSARASLDPRRDGRLVHRASILEAKLALRCARDTGAARAALERVLGDDLGTGLASVREHAETWLGLSLLFDGEHAEAAALLRRTVNSMSRCGRRLMLPVAAVYLSEAEWRVGEEEAADRAADTALAAGEFQGSNHLLLGALRDVPAVAWRRVEAEPDADSAWHRLARILRRAHEPRATATASGPDAIGVLEFGPQELMIAGSAVSPRLTKGHTLLAYLASRPGNEASRKAAVGDLFESGTDASTVAYLRLAVRSARETLPEAFDLTLDRQAVRFTPRGCLTSESGRFETLLASARSQVGAERLASFSRALEVHGRGAYLERDSSPWVHERRRELDDLAEEALFDAAETAYELGEYADAERLVRDGLAQNRFRESAWRLVMRIAAATRDDDALIAAYRECERAVGELGAEPSGDTTALLVDLRR